MVPQDSLKDAAQGSVFIRFNESSLFPAEITTPSSLVAVCPPFPAAGPVTAQVLIGPARSLLSEFNFLYVWPPTEAFPAMVPQGGGMLKLKVSDATWITRLLVVVAGLSA
jgi:hypothetical protein